MSAAEYAKARLFAPLGIDDWYWAAHDQHTSVGEAGLYLRPLDMAKLGQLYLQRGVWQGEQILPATWVDASITPHGTTNRWNDYGYSWWLYNQAAAQHHLAVTTTFITPSGGEGSSCGSCRMPTR
jgi:CubicO group peptidase (beta-lactamase class C family)